MAENSPNMATLSMNATCSNSKLFTLNAVPTKQGDQIGRIFASPQGDCFLCAVLWKLQMCPKFTGFFFHSKSCALILTKNGWSSSWAFFYKTILSPCHQTLFILVSSLPSLVGTCQVRPLSLCLTMNMVNNCNLCTYVCILWVRIKLHTYIVLVLVSNEKSSFFNFQMVRQLEYIQHADRLGTLNFVLFSGLLCHFHNHNITPRWNINLNWSIIFHGKVKSLSVALRLILLLPFLFWMNRNAQSFILLTRLSTTVSLSLYQTWVLNRNLIGKLWLLRFPF
jgi:hypothetical protein